MNLATGLLLLVIALGAANAPFLSRRILLVARPAGHDRGNDKAAWWRVLEIILLYFLVLGVARLLEANAGEIYRQNWEFYAITASLFLVFGYPGFVYRYLSKHRTP
jgi:hypothetical protein